MRKHLLIILICLAVAALAAAPVSPETALLAARAQFARAGLTTLDLALTDTVESGGATLAWVFTASDGGYAVVAADDALPPVIAYSARNAYTCPDDPRNTLSSLLRADLRLRRQAVSRLPESVLQQRANEWTALLSGERPRFDQWPPAGSTSTGGWVETQWTQSAPYNNFCPVDLASGNRAVAGCPAIAMGQIVAYWGTTNSTHFDDTDDYNHNYGGQNYVIDDDAATYDFPTFPELNDYLDAATTRMRYLQPMTDDDMAAIVFACGVAAHQVYSPGASGTFGVDQAMMAYERFNFQGATLLTEDDTDWQEQLAFNMMTGSPAHLAMVNTDWTSGHNVVVDGFNTDGYFHINFGWGGPYDSWYLLPDEFPYSLTVLEGVIVNIAPVNYAFATPDTLDFLSWDAPFQQTVTLFNMHSDTLVVEDVLFDTFFGGTQWWFEPELELPQTLQPGGSFSATLCLGIPVTGQRDTLSANLRIVCDLTTADVTVRLNSELLQDVDDDGVTSPVTELAVWPNPFNPETTISFTLAQPGHARLEVFNLRGQLVATLADETMPAGRNEIAWRADGLASGVYFARLQTEDGDSVRKLLLLK